jgi:mRNA interferase RelE/StbE
MTYTIVVPKTVKKQLDALSDEVFERISVKIQQLAENPRPNGVVKLKGSANEYRIRIGEYRVRYEIDDRVLVILLLQCRHRRDAYKER